MQPRQGLAPGRKALARRARRGPATPAARAPASRASVGELAHRAGRQACGRRIDGLELGDVVGLLRRRRCSPGWTIWQLGAELLDLARHDAAGADRVALLAGCAPKLPKNTRVRIARVVDRPASARAGPCRARALVGARWSPRRSAPGPPPRGDGRRGVRRTSECGRRNSTSRTIGPASFSSSGATRGPTPFSGSRDRAAKQAGTRISGPHRDWEHSLDWRSGHLAPRQGLALYRGPLSMHRHRRSRARRRLKFRAWRRGFRKRTSSWGRSRTPCAATSAPAELDCLERAARGPTTTSTTGSSSATRPPAEFDGR